MQCRRPQFDSWVRKIPWRRDGLLPTSVFLGFPDGSDGRESACNVGDLGSIPGLERLPGGGHGNPLQYFCLENPHGQRSLVGYSPWGHKESDTTERLSMHAVRCMYACIWASLVVQMVKNLPACGRPGFNPWVGKIPWRKAWQPTSVFLPGESPWTEKSGGL